MQPVAPFRRRVAEIDRLEWEGQGGDLVARNARVVDRMRARIRSGRFTRQGLRAAFGRVAGGSRNFDALDVLVAGLLNVGPPPEPTAELAAETVAFQPAPARAVLALADVLRPNDVLVDLGSGLGRVTILAALLAGCRARGIEREPAFCAYGERSAEALGVAGVAFTCADARRAPLGDGSVFFLFSPFRGELLRTVLERIPRSARIVTRGPCTADVARLPWVVEAASGEATVFAPMG